MTCDRCLKEVAVVIPWTRDLATNRVLMRCCLDCEAEQKACRYCGGRGTLVYEDDWHPCWCQRDGLAVTAASEAEA